VRLGVAGETAAERREGRDESGEGERSNKLPGRVYHVEPSGEIYISCV